MSRRVQHRDLFGSAPELPEGFAYAPESLAPLRARVAAWAGSPPDEFVHALVSEYRPGENQRREDVTTLELEPRSAYLMRGPARWDWQHSISETRELRYSIIFRTARRRA